MIHQFYYWSCDWIDNPVIQYLIGSISWSGLITLLFMTPVIYFTNRHSLPPIGRVQNASICVQSTHSDEMHGNRKCLPLQSSKEFLIKSRLHLHVQQTRDYLWTVVIYQWKNIFTEKWYNHFDVVRGQTKIFVRDLSFSLCSPASCLVPYRGWRRTHRRYRVWGMVFRWQIGAGNWADGGTRLSFFLLAWSCPALQPKIYL